MFLVISLQVSSAIVARQSPESVALPILTNYLGVIKSIATLANQLYVSLYYIDLNYGYDGELLHEEKRKINGKKFGMSML